MQPDGSGQVILGEPGIHPCLTKPDAEFRQAGAGVSDHAPDSKHDPDARRPDGTDQRHEPEFSYTGHVRFAVPYTHNG